MVRSSSIWFLKLILISFYDIFKKCCPIRSQYKSQSNMGLSHRIVNLSDSIRFDPVLNFRRQYVNIILRLNNTNTYYMVNMNNNTIIFYFIENWINLCPMVIIIWSGLDTRLILSRTVWSGLVLRILVCSILARTYLTRSQLYIFKCGPVTLSRYYS